MNMRLPNVISNLQIRNFCKKRNISRTILSTVWKYSNIIVPTDMELEIAIARKSKLQDTYEKIDKKLEKDLRFLKWQQKKSCRKNDKLFEKNCQTSCMSEQPSNLINCTQLKTMENINSSIFNFNKTSPEIKTHHIKPDYKENKRNHMSLFDKIKILQKNFKNDIGGKFGNQCLKQIGKFCHETLRAQFYDQSFYNESKIIKENLKTFGLKWEKQFTNKIKKIKKVETKNSILSEHTVVYNIEGDGTDVYKDVKLFEKSLRGRAYQTMVMMAEIKMKPFLQSMECVVLETSVHSSKSVTEDNKLLDGVLEYSTERYISRFFDTLSKESIRINEESKNSMMVELAEVTRTMREAREGNRRQLEKTMRKEQDEILKQVLKIHQDLSELFTEEFMKKAIEQCAEEEGLKLMREITSKKTFSGNTFYSINCKSIENELVYNTIIPEAYKILHREDIY